MMWMNYDVHSVPPEVVKSCSHFGKNICVTSNNGRLYMWNRNSVPKNIAQAIEKRHLNKKLYTNSVYNTIDNTKSK